MKCPNCEGVDLAMGERQGVEIDYCPKCRGVWLDRGKLDSIIERSAPAGGMRRGDRSDEEHDGGYNGPGRGRSWFTDLFD